MSSESDEADSSMSAQERDLATAYARGDFAHVRARVREWLRDPKATPKARERLRGWSQRVSVDVVVYAMLAFALLVFCAIVLRYAVP